MILIFNLLNIYMMDYINKVTDSPILKFFAENIGDLENHTILNLAYLELNAEDHVFLSNNLKHPTKAYLGESLSDIIYFEETTNLFGIGRKSDVGLKLTSVAFANNDDFYYKAANGKLNRADIGDLEKLFSLGGSFDSTRPSTALLFSKDSNLWAACKHENRP